jgi:pyruvate/2-oxoglutarate/acetoin dehydrogenase E1 component
VRQLAAAFTAQACLRIISAVAKKYFRHGIDGPMLLLLRQQAAANQGASKLAHSKGFASNYQMCAVPLNFATETSPAAS